MKILRMTFLLLVAFTFTLPTISAQSGWKAKLKEKRKKRKEKRAGYLQYNVQSLGLTYGTFQDLRLSNQIYQGAGLGLQRGTFTQTKNSIREFNFFGNINFVSSQGDVSGYDFAFDWNYSHLFLVNKESTSAWKMAVGPKMSTLTQFRLVPSLGNSSFHWDGVVSLGAAATVDRDWTVPFIKKDISLYGKAHLPLVAYVNRPIYGVSVFDFPEQTIAAIGGMFRMETELGMTFPVRKGNPNLLSVSYRWDMFRFRDNEIHRVITGHHGLNFGIWIRMR